MESRLLYVHIYIFCIAIFKELFLHGPIEYE